MSENLHSSIKMLMLVFQVILLALCLTKLTDLLVLWYDAITSVGSFIPPTLSRRYSGALSCSRCGLIYCYLVNNGD